MNNNRFELSVKNSGDQLVWQDCNPSQKKNKESSLSLSPSLFLSLRLSLFLFFQLFVFLILKLKSANVIYTRSSNSRRTQYSCVFPLSSSHQQHQPVHQLDISIKLKEGGKKKTIHCDHFDFFCTNFENSARSLFEKKGDV